MNIQLEREEDGRWIAEVPELPGVMVYGQSREEAIAKVKALVGRVHENNRLIENRAEPRIT